MNEPIPVSRAVDHGTAKLMPDVDRERAWLLTVDGAPQSYVDLDEPTHLEFEYARRLGHVLDVAGEPGAPLDAVHLGGGAMTLPRYLAVTRPGSRQDVVEADAGLAALVAEVLPLPAGGGVAVHTVDARAWLEAASDSSADVVVGDVFGGSQVPAHLTTVGYVDEVARVLRGGGVYLANLADAAPFAFLRSQVATVGTRFAEVVLVAEPAVLRGRRFGNVVVAASDRALDIPALTRAVAGDPFPARVVRGEALWRWVGEARPVSEVTAVPSPLPPSGAFAVG
ncbi:MULTISPECIES: spermidine synthase [Streptomyces]|uniref:Spermidine synthase n=2 Tax=Streptomyces TaxID=1883 RepID=A0ABU0KM61_9ACTN|nr:spermidine synthase [Streptomyces thermodiastaticus]MXQ59637.1 spermidine synthase-like protein [Streptomyces sp. XHT-2]THC59477.1 spermidine synthase-like protein [Streptomyces sp. Akac8]UVT08577.1 fused MFS/spermidine synthase [Streptomyces thermocarboxydus]WSB40191.1 fused MFS/spermidine synthase [Streptomyces cellulosae]